MRININADMGESWGAFRMGDDAGLLGAVASANIACGLHGGDPRVMADTIRLARDRGVSIGAHPGYADLHGFGRRAMILSDADLEALVLYQLGALAGMAHALGHPMTHVKPHGAMNNQAAADRHMADVIAGAIRSFDPGLILLAPVLSELAAAGSGAGLKVALEIFADRTYEEDGQLTPRALKGSVLHDPEAARDHVLAMLDAGGIVTRTGKVLQTPFHSVCVHGDGAAAVAAARLIRHAVEAAGHQVLPLPDLV